MRSATLASLPRIACAPVATPRAGLGAPSPARRSRMHLPAKNGRPESGQKEEKQQPSFWENFKDTAPILLSVSFVIAGVIVDGALLTLVVSDKIDTTIKGAIKEFQDPINAKLLASDARLSESLKASRDALAATAKTSQHALKTSQHALTTSHDASAATAKTFHDALATSAQTCQYALVAVVAVLAVVVVQAVSKDNTNGKGKR